MDAIALLRYGLPLALGILLGGWIQGMRWDADIAARDREAAKSYQAMVEDKDVQLEEREKRRVATQVELSIANEKIDALDRAIADGSKRVFVRATCPTVPETSAVSGGTGSGAAELDPAYRPVVSQLRREAERQLALLNLCRAELRARSAPIE